MLGIRQLQLMFSNIRFRLLFTWLTEFSLEGTQQSTALKMEIKYMLFQGTQFTNSTKGS